MTDYAVTGKKRSGKGLFCSGLIRDALREGRPVATNMDIFVEHLLPPHSRATFYRLPDCPTVADLEAIGKGNEIVDDSKNGIIVLDEASKFFNARSWGDKERQPLLDWLIHSGKLGWDVYYQMQGLEQVDKQLRTTQVEYHIAVKRTDRWPIPFVTALFKIVGLNVTFPRMHLGVIRHGCERDSLLIGRKWYRALDLYQAYDTRQKFLDRTHPQACGLHSMLSPWHLKGRFMRKWDLYKPILYSGMAFGVVLGVLVGLFGGYKWFSPKAAESVKVQADTSIKVTGQIQEAGNVRLFLSDGRVVMANEEKRDGGNHLYRVGEKWFKAE